MATTTTKKIGTVANQVADTLTGARTDTSGLMSAVIAYMGDANGPGRREVHERARHAGLEARLSQWEKEPGNEPAGEDTVRTLFPDSVITRFSEETGHSRNATVKGLADLLPHLSRLDG
ncbi:YidB family protein [Komagataeibacter sp. FNDCF1]|uniref:YidB family protein n=1 Tax=Komagataeibacter sp. FNDCF1 TaxID=2878681 RepID=UPI001E60EE5C|nr:YidB family protein [Komagataeibacter sp. FNDCF1]MCE2565178.1 YidB family protein [Komagataeibacter sp. FNDCF1]